MGKALTSPETETQAQESVFGIKGSAPSHWLLSQVNTSPRNCALAWWGVRGCTCCMCWVTMFNHCWCRWRPKSRVGIYSWISWLMAENKRLLVYRRGSLCYLRDLSQVLFSIWTITINTTLCFYNCAVFDLYTISGQISSKWLISPSYLVLIPGIVFLCKFLLEEQVISGLIKRPEWWQPSLISQTTVKNVGFMKEVSYTHQGCIYLIQNTLII